MIFLASTVGKVLSVFVVVVVVVVFFPKKLPFPHRISNGAPLILITPHHVDLIIRSQLLGEGVLRFSLDGVCRSSLETHYHF